MQRALVIYILAIGVHRPVRKRAPVAFDVI